MTHPILTILILLTLTFSCNQPASSNKLKSKKGYNIRRANVESNPFSRLDFNKIIAYDFDCWVKDDQGGHYEELFDKTGKLTTYIKNKAEIGKTNIVNILGDTSTYGSARADCFNPHLGIVFYKDSKVKAWVSICLECNYLSSSIDISELYRSKIDEYGEEFLANGFSEMGYEKLSTLCKSLGFSHCKR
jgi:hypothetical protein